MVVSEHSVVQIRNLVNRESGQKRRCRSLRSSGSKREILRAIRRQPSSAAAWSELARLEQQLGDLPGLAIALDRALALDPRSPVAHAVVEWLFTLRNSPNGSATATGTPLPRQGFQTPGAPALPAGVSGSATSGGP